MCVCAQFQACLTRELEAAQADQAAFENDFSPEDFQEVVAGWTDKLNRAAVGEQRWALFTATKPAAM